MYFPASSFWKSAMTKRKMITMAAIRPDDTVSLLDQNDVTEAGEPVDERLIVLIFMGIMR